MLRVLSRLIAVICCTVVLAEGVGLALLWFQGALTSQKMQELRTVWAGDRDPNADHDSEDTKTQMPSQQEVQSARVMRILDLESREKELDLMKSMTVNIANRLISDRQNFDEMKEAFFVELQELNTRHQTEAMEQARAVLMASPPETVVERLMALELHEAIDLVRGMPEKSIAKFLQGFSIPGAKPEQAQRGREIFEALARGKPAQPVIQEALRQFPNDASEVREGAVK